MQSSTIELNEIAKQHSAWVARMGWHNKTVLESIALIASEIGEAAAEVDANRRPTAAFGEELADIVLRTMDLSVTEGVDLDAEVAAADVKWRGTGLEGSIEEDFADVYVDIGKWVNTVRGDAQGPEFGRRMGVIVRRVLEIAERNDINLANEVVRKMTINAERGTRGRRI
jgi:NTP pyrophosphatase (non-canonical NTP hydrolase)